jgi:hypothetical protein
MTSTLGGAPPQFDDKRFNLLLWMLGDRRTYQNVAGTNPTIIDLDTVQSWDDISGNGRSFSENDVNVRLRFPPVAGILNHKSVHNRASGTGKLQLTGADSSVLNFRTADPRTIYVRFSVGTPVTATNYLIDKQLNGSTGWTLLTQNNGAGGGEFKYELQRVNSANRMIVNFGTLAANTAYEVWITDPGTGVAADVGARLNRVNQVTVPTDVGTIGETTSTAVLTLLGRGDGLDASDANIEELLVWGGVIADPDKVSFENNWIGIRNP